MNRVLVYVATAIVLGLVITLVPTWIFIGGADVLGQAADHQYSLRDANALPFLETTAGNHVDLVSFEELGILGFSVLMASVVYVVSKRRP
ncbi:MAG: hypothetical protein JSW72_03525 [Candidatus Bathyarchaeota archaeon]|nr:MAG: hypothetical protein JSW72_03525 [Candidatus Bathyarchaeota archaeon]